MSNKKQLDIKLHFITTKPGKGQVLPKKHNFPVDLKSIIAYNDASDVNTSMSLYSIESMLSNLADSAYINGFDREKNDYSVNKKQFFAGSYLYGITDNDIDVDSCTTCSINKAWLAAKDENIWREMVRNAKEEYEPVTVLGRTRCGTANVPIVKQVLVSRTLHLVVIVTCSKKQISRKRTTPPLSADALRSTSTKAAKKAEKLGFKLNFSKLQLEINSPIWKINDTKNDLLMRKTMNSDKSTKSYNFRQFIIRGSSEERTNQDISSIDSNRSSPENSVSTLSPTSNPTSQCDDMIGHHFRLSSFRKDIMLIALKEESESYSGIISTKSKLYINQSYSASSWKEVKSTAQLHNIILEENEKKKRIVDDHLKLRVSLGYNRNLEPITDSLHDYFDDDAFSVFSHDTSHAMSP